jgi:hypothetical protein
MENASLVLQGALKNIRDDGFDLNAMRGVDISNLLLDRARATPAGEKLVEQARAYGYRPEDKWSAMAR